MDSSVNCSMQCDVTGKCCMNECESNRDSAKAVNRITYIWTANRCTEAETAFWTIGFDLWTGTLYAECPLFVSSQHHRVVDEFLVALSFKPMPLPHAAKVGYIEAKDRPTILNMIYHMVSLQQMNLILIFTEAWSAEVNMPLRSDIEAMDRPTILYIKYSLASVQQMNLFVCNGKILKWRHFSIGGLLHINGTSSQYIISYSCGILCDIYVHHHHSNH